MIVDKNKLMKSYLEVYNSFCEGDLSENEFVKALFQKSSKERVESLFNANKQDIYLLFATMLYMRDYPKMLKDSFMAETNNLHISLLLISLANLLNHIRDYTGDMCLPDGNLNDNMLYLLSVIETHIV